MDFSTRKDFNVGDYGLTQPLQNLGGEFKDVTVIVDELECQLPRRAVISAAYSSSMA